jgi:tetratricopeptide (TPR) repeat protein
MKRRKGMLAMAVALLAIAGTGRGQSHGEAGRFFLDQAAQAFRRGDARQALAYVDEAIRIQDRSEYFIFRALLHKEAQNVRAAIRDCNEAIKRESGNARAFALRGDVHLSQRNYDRALADYRKAILLEPTFHAVYIVRGKIYMVLGRYEEARASFTRAIELKPEDPTVYERRAEALLKLGKSGLAKADLAVCREAGGIPSQALVYRIEQAQ